MIGSFLIGWIELQEIVVIRFGHLREHGTIMPDWIKYNRPFVSKVLVHDYLEVVLFFRPFESVLVIVRPLGGSESSFLALVRSKEIPAHVNSAASSGLMKWVGGQEEQLDVEPRLYRFHHSTKKDFKIMNTWWCSRATTSVVYTSLKNSPNLTMTSFSVSKLKNSYSQTDYEDMNFWACWPRVTS